MPAGWSLAEVELVVADCFFGRAPRLYVLHGALSAVCRLEPSAFRARVAGG